MFQQDALKLVVVGAALATIAAVLVPINVLLLSKSMISVLIVVVIVQVLLLAAAGAILYKAHRQSRR